MWYLVYKYNCKQTKLEKKKFVDITAKSPDILAVSIHLIWKSSQMPLSYNV